MNRTARCAGAGLALLLALGVAGCGGPVEELVRGGTERLVEDQTGLEIETGDDGVSVKSKDGSLELGGSAQVPEDFPAELPLPDAAPTASLSAGGSWNLTFEGVGAAEVDRLIGALAEAGYEELASTQVADTRQASYQSERWSINIVWDGSSSGSQVLVYSVVAR